MGDYMKIALAGNPNSGKTTLFNGLTGSNQYVGNWPGVTVEEKNGRLKGHDGVTVQDLPGIYSLSPYSLEEKVSRNSPGRAFASRASPRSAGTSVPWWESKTVRLSMPWSTMAS